MSFIAFLNAFSAFSENSPPFLVNRLGKFIYLQAFFRVKRKKLAFSAIFRKKSYLCTCLSACGEIGRRARLRIWCRETCRFESYQAHVLLNVRNVLRNVPLSFLVRRSAMPFLHPLRSRVPKFVFRHL